jgi:hypothetical protein
MINVSAIIMGHHEGIMAGISLRSLLAAVQAAQNEGISTEIMVVLDRPDQATRDVFGDADKEGWRVIETDYGDQGKVRNHAVGMAKGEYIAFLDGDDLWSENWLLDAYTVCCTSPGKIIAHPELDWFFGESNNLLLFTDQLDPSFDPALLRFINYWDALCMAPREAHVRYPYSDRNVSNGIAYEDWYWNCETLDAGFIHRIVPQTIHFKRRRSGSQTIKASTGKCQPPTTALQHYDWYVNRQTPATTSAANSDCEPHLM